MRLSRRCSYHRDIALENWRGCGGDVAVIETSLLKRRYCRDLAIEKA